MARKDLVLLQVSDFKALTRDAGVAAAFAVMAAGAAGREAAVAGFRNSSTREEAIGLFKRLETILKTKPWACLRTFATAPWEFC
jgi:hypothetical protein